MLWLFFFLLNEDAALNIRERCEEEEEEDAKQWPCYLNRKRKGGGGKKVREADFSRPEDSQFLCVFLQNAERLHWHGKGRQCCQISFFPDSLDTPPPQAELKMGAKSL